MSRMMKAAMWNGGPDLQIQEVPIPLLHEDEVLIDVSHTGICASDLHLCVPGGPFPPPLIPGHEFSGVVAETGTSVGNFRAGDRVVAHPVGPCGACFYCREGRENLCLNPHMTFTTPPGGSFAEYIVVKEKQTYHLPAEIPLRDGALVEPAAIAVHCMDRAEIKAGQTVLVIGGGPIGQFVVQLVGLQGAARIILAEPEAHRRAAGRSGGAGYAIDPLREDLPGLVKSLTEGRGVDVAIEAAGNPGAIEAAVGLLRPGGRLVIVGWAPDTSAVGYFPFLLYRYELEIRGSFFSPYSFNRTIDLLPRLNLAPVVTHTFSLDQVNEAWETSRGRKGIKVLIEP